MLNQLASLARTDFRPRHGQPRTSRLVLATIAAVAGSLAADALLVVIAQAALPSTRGYPHFQFPDYAKLTVIGVAGCFPAWPCWVTLMLWVPDVYLLYRGQQGDAVGVLFLMHLAIALVTYNLLVHLAPVRPSWRVVPSRPGLTDAEVR